MRGRALRRSVGMNLLIGGLIALCAAMFAAPASASLSVAGPQALTGVEGVDQPPVILYDPTGRATVLWGARFNGDPGVKWVRIGADGTAGEVQTLTTGAPVGPISAVVDSDGDITAGWVDLNSGAVLARIAQDGTTTSPTPLGGFTDPDLVADSSDRVTVVWSTGPINAIRLGDDGTVDYAARQISVTSDNSSPDATVDPDGRVSVAWLDLAGTEKGIVLGRIATDGTPGAPIPLGTALDYTTPRAVTDSSGRVTTVWSHAAPDDDLVARRVATDGTAGTTQTLLDENGGYANPAAVVDSQGRVTAGLATTSGGKPALALARVGSDGAFAGSRTLEFDSIDPKVQLEVDGTDRVVAAFYASGGTTNGESAVRMKDGKLSRVVTFGGSDTRGLTRTPGGEIAIASRASGAVVLWKTGTVDPLVSIDSGPPDTSDDTTPTFEFSSDEPEATFECSWDGGAFSACASPVTFGGALPAGSHSFRVRATDPDGRTATSAPRTFTVSGGPPEPPVVTKACKRAKAKLKQANAKLKKARKSGTKADVKKAKARVKKAKAGVRKAC